MKRKNEKNNIVIRTNWGNALWFLICSIVYIYLFCKYNEIYMFIGIIIFLILSVLSYTFKIKLLLHFVDIDSVLTVDNGIVMRDFNINTLTYYVSKPFIVLEDDKHSMVLEKNRKLIHELKKLRVIEKELK